MKEIFTKEEVSIPVYTIPFVFEMGRDVQLGDNIVWDVQAPGQRDIFTILSINRENSTVDIVPAHEYFNFVQMKKDKEETKKRQRKMNIDGLKNHLKGLL